MILYGISLYKSQNKENKKSNAINLHFTPTDVTEKMENDHPVMTCAYKVMQHRIGTLQ